MKKILSLILAAVLCAFVFASCNAKESNTIVVAASSTPHAEILEQCKPILEKQGYKLEVMVMDDYVTPNEATESGDVDANYFQHQPYLDQFNSEKGTKLVSIASVHYEPYAIYAGTCTSLADIADGAIIAVPNDATNEARALLLLEAEGLIDVRDDAGLTATKNDIVSNPKNLDIREMEAALLPTVLDEVAVAVINGNYALGAGLDVSKSLAMEKSDSEAAQTYANVLVVHESNKDNGKLKALADALLTETISKFISEKYNGAVVPMN
ncbi:MAG: MetQ/NlpA family ABC transporter substrate-binding protein [Ruminococcaceae bacterium]|nr:MetQ/NlpA family ABC transporter substrate-binding protein [Oscillospiraceae bacterium]